MPRYFIAPKGYKTERQFDDNQIPSWYLMPEGNLAFHESETDCTLELLAHIAAKHCNFLPAGFVFRTDTTTTEYPPELTEAIENALQTIAHAINDYCPTIYPTGKD